MNRIGIGNFLNCFVNAVFDKNLFESFGVQPVLHLALLNFKLCRENIDQSVGIVFENIAHRGNIGTFVFDDQGIDADGLLAVGKSVKRIYSIFGMHTPSKADFNFDSLTRIIADTRDFEFVFPGCTFNRGDKRFRRRAKRQLAHNNAFGIFGIEFGSHEHFAIAVGVFGDIDKTTRRKIGKDLKILPSEIGNFRLQQFDQIVGQNRVVMPGAIPSVPCASSTGIFAGKTTGSLLRPS